MSMVASFVLNVFTGGVTKVKFAAGIVGAFIQVGIVSTGIMFLTKMLNAMRGEIAKTITTAFIT